jgi:pyruvate/2-oxoglutarate dehydrogenase complex dihydrolipoamide dehydrogenase (E3) component
MLPNILPIEDTEVSQALEKSFAKQGVQLLTNHKTTKTEAIGEGVRIAVADPSQGGGENVGSGNGPRGNRCLAGSPRGIT